jgi:hypothetical protein
LYQYVYSNEVEEYTLSRMFGRKGEVMEGGENYVMEAA